MCRGNDPSFRISFAVKKSSRSNPAAGESQPPSKARSSSSAASPPLVHGPSAVSAGSPCWSSARRSAATQELPRFEPGSGRTGAAHRVTKLLCEDEYAEAPPGTAPNARSVARRNVASADAIKQYQTKTRKIAEETERVAQTTEEVRSKQEALQATEDEWKPALKEMVESVDRSFSSYFRTHLLFILW